MYIAHDCKICKKGSFVFGIYEADNEVFTCNVCFAKENKEQFWEGIRSEQYLRELENELENHFADKDLYSLENSIEIAVGYHVLGDFEGRDFCINRALKECKNLKDKWQICYCYFNVVEQKITSFEKTAKKYPEHSEPYRKNLETIRQVFQDLPEQIKRV